MVFLVCQFCKNVQCDSFNLTGWPSISFTLSAIIVTGTHLDVRVEAIRLQSATGFLISLMVVPTASWTYKTVYVCNTRTDNSAYFLFLSQER